MLTYSQGNQTVILKAKEFNFKTVYLAKTDYGQQPPTQLKNMPKRRQSVSGIYLFLPHTRKKGKHFAACKGYSKNKKQGKLRTL